MPKLPASLRPKTLKRIGPLSRRRATAEDVAVAVTGAFHALLLAFCCDSSRIMESFACHADEFGRLAEADGEAGGTILRRMSVLTMAMEAEEQSPRRRSARRA
jgi:hypothetical protein